MKRRISQQLILMGGYRRTTMVEIRRLPMNMVIFSTILTWLLAGESGNYSGISHVEATAAMMSLTNEFSNNLMIACYTDSANLPPFVAKSSQQYTTNFQSQITLYLDCMLQYEPDIPEIKKTGTFRMWGNPNLPGTIDDSRLGNCMKCNWKVDNSGLLLQQPDLAYSLIWTWI
jgi:hypothetical protein